MRRAIYGVVAVLVLGIVVPAVSVRAADPYIAITFGDGVNDLTSPAGVTVSFTVEARDSAGNRDQGFTGSMNIYYKSSIVASPTFTYADQGRKYLSFTPTHTTAPARLDAFGFAYGAFGSSAQLLEIKAGQPLHFYVSQYAGPMVAGDWVNRTFTAVDGYGNDVGTNDPIGCSTTETRISIPSPCTLGFVNGSRFYTAGTQTFTVRSLDTTASLTVSYTVTPAAPTTLTPSDIGTIGVPVNGPPPHPLRVRFTDAYGNGVSGKPITLTIGTSSSGATAFFATGSRNASGTTDAQGYAVVPPFVANLVTDSPYTLTASSASPGATATFTLTNGTIHAPPDGRAPGPQDVIPVGVPTRGAIPIPPALPTPVAAPGRR